MSFSNTDTGNKTADPYKEKNIEHPSLKEKVEDLVAFIDKHKFCMMTTRVDQSGLLASRCMALAAKVRTSSVLVAFQRSNIPPRIPTSPLLFKISPKPGLLFLSPVIYLTVTRRATAST
jgi:hypothetical protein